MIATETFEAHTYLGTSGRNQKLLNIGQLRERMKSFEGLSGEAINFDDRVRNPGAISKISLISTSVDLTRNRAYCECPVAPAQPERSSGNG